MCPLAALENHRCGEIILEESSRKRTRFSQALLPKNPILNGLPPVRSYVESYRGDSLRVWNFRRGDGGYVGEVFYGLEFLRLGFHVLRRF